MAHTDCVCIYKFSSLLTRDNASLSSFPSPWSKADIQSSASRHYSTGKEMMVTSKMETGFEQLSSWAAVIAATPPGASLNTPQNLFCFNREPPSGVV